MFAVHELDKLRNPGVIKLVKNVIQQKNGCFPRKFPYPVHLRELQRDKERFLLALAADFFQRTAVHFKKEVIFVDSARSVG